MLEFEMIARGLYRPEQLIIDYRPDLRMPMTTELHQWMEREWHEKLAQAKERGTLLFDAPLFRFGAATPEPGGNLRLLIGDTGYKEYVTTRSSAFAARHDRQELGNPLAVCSVIETSDGYILLDKRAGVDVYEGRYHVIGGFFERERDHVQGKPDPFGAIRREIQEETGILPEDSSEVYCLGVVYDLNVPHAELCFLTRLHISLHEVTHQRVPLDHEVKHLQTLYITEQSLRDFIVEHHGNISATGEPNLLYYGAWRFGAAWFEDVLNIIRSHSL